MKANVDEIDPKNKMIMSTRSASAPRTGSVTRIVYSSNKMKYNKETWSIENNNE